MYAQSHSSAGADRLMYSRRWPPFQALLSVNLSVVVNCDLIFPCRRATAGVARAGRHGRMRPDRLCSGRRRGLVGLCFGISGCGVCGIVRQDRFGRYGIFGWLWSGSRSGCWLFRGSFGRAGVDGVSMEGAPGRSLCFVVGRGVV